MAGQIEVRAAYDDQLIKTLPLMGWEQVDQHLEKAYQLAQMKPLALAKRLDILEKTAALVEKNKAEFARQAAEEGGKPLIDSRVELDRALGGIRLAIEGMKNLHGTEIPMNLTPSSQGRMAYTLREPIGVVAAVSAFNHPFNLIVHQAVPAVAAGCPILVKPASATPLSCIALVETLYQAGLPPEWCQTILCDNPTAEKMVTDPRVSFFSFIGSGRVGWYLHSQLAPGTRSALEHGGAAPVIVEPDADFDDMVPLLAKGGFYHAGQVCVSVQRIFAHESIADKLGQALSQAAKKLKVGDPTDDLTEVGPLIKPKENDRVASWVKEAKDEGAEILTGGQKISETCYEPTVLMNPSLKSKVCRQEIFGPVICINAYTDRNEAIAKANDVAFSFQASVFGKNIDNLLDTVKKLNAVAVMVNDHTAFRVDWMPFGGEKSSGLGLGGIPYTLNEYTTEKLMVIRSPALMG